MAWCNSRVLLVLAAALSGTVLSPDASLARQQSTIPETLATAGKSLIRVNTVPSGKPPSLAEVLREAETIVRGTVGEPRSYLSNDEREIRTEYPIQHPAVRYKAETATFAKPGATPGISVTLAGGAIERSGLRFTEKHEALPRLDPGTECVFLLERGGDEYRVALDYFGAFAVQGERLKPLTAKQGFAPELRDLPADQAIADMVAQLRAMRP